MLRCSKHTLAVTFRINWLLKVRFGFWQLRSLGSLTWVCILNNCWRLIKLLFLLSNPILLFVNLAYIQSINPKLAFSQFLLFLNPPQILLVLPHCRPTCNSIVIYYQLCRTLLLFIQFSLLMEVQQIFLLHFLKATSSACRLQCDPNLIKLLNDFLLLGACNILLHNWRWRLEATLLLHNNVSVLWWRDDVVIFRILVHCSDKCSKNWLLEFNSDMWVNLFTH